MSSSWRYWYDVLVIALSVLAFIVALELRHDGLSNRRNRLARVGAWIGGAALAVRGIAGMIVDGRADPVWWPTFLAGGVVFIAIAWLATASRRAAQSGAVM